VTGPSQVLVLNSGSSSIKYQLIDMADRRRLAAGLVERIGESGPGRLKHEDLVSGETVRVERGFPDHAAGMAAALATFEEAGPPLEQSALAAVGHRVVHGGEAFAAPTLLDDEVIKRIKALNPLAPLHNPANLVLIDVARRVLPDVPQVAVFDTAFHQTLPPHAYTYAVPLSLREEHQIRRYGFHGTSYSFVAADAARVLGRPLSDLNLIVLHLGNGASATAIERGRSVDTSMGISPLEGLVMGTRSGDVDPALHAHLHRQLGWSIDDVDRVLNRESGLRGLSGYNDFRDVDRWRQFGDEGPMLAFDVFCYRIRKYVGAYYAVLGTVDAVVFTAGVGENAASMRAAALSGLERLGIAVDSERNERRSDEPWLISPEGSEVAVLVVQTNEEWEIARQAMAVVGDVG
jgi:acetate kinase